MNTVSLTVTLGSDGNVEDLADMLAQYLTGPDYPFLTDYAAKSNSYDEVRDDGYEGPFVRMIRVQRGIHYRRWEE